MKLYNKRKSQGENDWAGRLGRQVGGQLCGDTVCICFSWSYRNNPDLNDGSSLFIHFSALKSGKKKLISLWADSTESKKEYKK